MDGLPPLQQQLLYVTLLLLVFIVVIAMARSNGQKEHYDNCLQARAAGQANIQRGNKLYRPQLDRDHNGIACEVR